MELYIVSHIISARLHKVFNWDILNEKCYVNVGPVFNHNRISIENSRNPHTEQITINCL
jgi:hypothetical protein